MYRFFVRCVSGSWRRHCGRSGLVVSRTCVVCRFRSGPCRRHGHFRRGRDCCPVTGGSERLQTGLDLLREGAADDLFVSGVWPLVRLAKIFCSVWALRASQTLAARLSLAISLQIRWADAWAKQRYKWSRTGEVDVGSFSNGRQLPLKRRSMLEVKEQQLAAAD